MPIYCFTSDEGERNPGETIEGYFPMGKCPEFVKIAADGAVVKVGLYEPIGDDVQVYNRDLAAEWAGGPKSGERTGWPIECYASGVHADQATDLRAHFKKHGVDCEVTNNGDPVYTDPQHRKRCLKVRGLHDNASFGT